MVNDDVSARLQAAADDVGVTMVTETAGSDRERAFEKFQDNRRSYAPPDAFPYDILRYAYTIPAERYAVGVATLQQALRASGNTEVGFKNLWLNPSGFRGIVAFLETPDGQRFEVQIHTAESWQAAQDTHPDYVIARDPSTNPHDAAAAKQRSDAVFSTVTAPPDVETAVPIGSPQWQPAVQ